MDETFTLGNRVVYAGKTWVVDDEGLTSGSERLSYEGLDFSAVRSASEDTDLQAWDRQLGLGRTPEHEHREMFRLRIRSHPVAGALSMCPAPGLRVYHGDHYHRLDDSGVQVDYGYDLNRPPDMDTIECRGCGRVMNNVPGPMQNLHVGPPSGERLSAASEWTRDHPNFTMKWTHESGHQLRWEELMGPGRTTTGWRWFTPDNQDMGVYRPLGEAKRRVEQHVKSKQSSRLVNCGMHGPTDQCYVSRGGKHVDSSRCTCFSNPSPDCPAHGGDLRQVGPKDSATYYNGRWVPDEGEHVTFVPTEAPSKEGIVSDVDSNVVYIDFNDGTQLIHESAADDHLSKWETWTGLVDHMADAHPGVAENMWMTNKNLQEAHRRAHESKTGWEDAWTAP